MKRIVPLALCFMCFAYLAVTGCNNDVEDKNVVDVDVMQAVIEFSGFGSVELELYPKLAPQTVYNFCYLARQGFYDGLTIHRIEKGFVIQGGDPDGNGRGGPGYCIKGEFAQNGWDNSLLHTRGVISMARRSAPNDSAGSQFFIVLEDKPFLDGAYAAFGKVVAGMEVVDAIANTPIDSLTKQPAESVVITKITITGPELPAPNKLRTP